MPGQFRPRGVMMPDCSRGRAGFDRVLMAVAASFLTVSSAMAQADPARTSAAELAIDAAIPRPEPANLPPLTINDFKLDTTATVPDPATEAAKTDTATTTEKPAEPKPADVVTAPPAEPDQADTAKKDTAATTTAPPAAAEPAKEPVKEPVKAASNVAPADQPVADRLRELLGTKSLRYFDRKAERAAVEKFYATREFAPLLSGKARSARQSRADRGGTAASRLMPTELFSGVVAP